MAPSHWPHWTDSIRTEKPGDDRLDDFRDARNETPDRISQLLESRAPSEYFGQENRGILGW